eukprot:1159037-Pelagomonas_calceolata.AAC.7
MQNVSKRKRQVPAARRLLALACTFLVSGLMHELLLLICTGRKAAAPYMGRQTMCDSCSSCYRCDSCVMVVLHAAGVIAFGTVHSSVTPIDSECKQERGKHCKRACVCKVPGDSHPASKLDTFMRSVQACSVKALAPVSKVCCAH